jgi:hypothetical protein
MMRLERLLGCAILLVSWAARGSAQAGAPVPAAPASQAGASAPSAPATASPPPAAAATSPAAAPEQPTAAASQPAAADATAAQPTATPGAAAAAASTPAAEHEPPPEQNPYPNATQHHWTEADVQRVRAMLAAEHEQERLEAAAARNKPKPVKHGNAGAALALGLSIDAVFHSDEGYHLFDHPTANARLGFWAGYDLATLDKRAVLSGDLGFGVEDMDGNHLFGGDVTARLLSQTIQAGVSVRWTGCSFLAPQLRASGGVSLFDLQLTVDSEPRTHDHATSGFGALGAGFLLHTPARTFENGSGQFASLTFGLQFEAGYAVRSSVDFALRSQPSNHAIPVVNANLGRLDLSGAYIRTSLVARF